MSENLEVLRLAVIAAEAAWLSLGDPAISDRAAVDRFLEAGDRHRRASRALEKAMRSLDEPECRRAGA